MKTCKACGEEKQVVDFYPGHARCKECYCAIVREHRNANIEHYREYDRQRGNRQTKEYQSEYRRRFPRKYKATNAINNAIRDGRMKREPCEICGREDANAHHDDYAYPLTVRWLCPPHHHQWHRDNGPGRNGE